MHQRAIVDSQALNVRFDASSLHKSPGERIERERKERERERASCPRTWWNIERVTSFDLAPTRSILDFSDTRAHVYVRVNGGLVWKERERDSRG